MTSGSWVGWVDSPTLARVAGVSPRTDRRWAVRLQEGAPAIWLPCGEVLAPSDLRLNALGRAYWAPERVAGIRTACLPNRGETDSVDRADTLD